MARLTTENAALLIVDIQQKLLPAMLEPERLLHHASVMTRGAAALDIPILITEQNSARLGTTVPEIAKPAGNAPRFEKLAFSCFGAKGLPQALKALGRTQIILIGIETHVCVYQTALDLLHADYEVHICSDAVSSRLASHRDCAIHRIGDLGGTITNSEMALFEMLGKASGERFKSILQIVR